MATLVQTAVKIWTGGLDLSCYSDNVNLDLMADDVEFTTYCSAGAREYRQGLKSWEANATGFADFAAAGATTSQLVPGEVIVPTAQGSYFPMIIAPTGAEDGAAYLADSILTSFTVLSGAVGDAAAIAAKFRPSDNTVGHRIIRGRLEASRTSTASGNTTGSQLGAISATQKLWAALQVVTLAGTGTPTITVKIQSDDGSGFATPTDRISFSAATTRSSQWGSVAGAITDDYWRANFTISGTGPSIVWACAIGIL